MLCYPMLKISQKIFKLSTSALTVSCLFGLFFIFGFAGEAQAATYESTFTSRILDAHHPSVEYETINWTSEVPTSTSLTIELRGGDTDVPDGSWTPWVSVSNGQDIGADFDNFRFLQYRAVLGTTDLSETPVLKELRIGSNISALVSSLYDSNDSKGRLENISWEEVL